VTRSAISLACSCCGPAPPSGRTSSRSATDPAVATKIALRSLARRLSDRGDEIAEFDHVIEPLFTGLAPGPLEKESVGIKER
jgi:hypothetical protein